MSELEKKVLDAIEERNLAARPYAYFLARRSVFWSLAIPSILLGAVAVAVAIFALSDLFATGGRKFEEMPLDDVFESLPVIWFAIFLLFTASAVFGFRHTRRGYRYRPAIVIGLSIAAALVLGLLLHAFDAGRITHNYLVSHFPAYERFTYVPHDQWDDPDQGFLGGYVVELIGDKSLRLIDFHDQEWVVDISSAVNKVDEPLDEEGHIAIRGTRSGPATFRALVIEPFD